MSSAPVAQTGASGATDFEELYQQAPCGYLVTADDGTIRSVNDTFLTWTGHTREDLLGTRLSALLPVGDQILWSTHCTPTLRMAGAVAEVVVEVLSVERRRLAALLTATRTSPPDGPATVRVIVFGAQERRRHEKELVAALRRAEESEARRASAEADLQHLVLHDPLTGLPNRVGLAALLQEALSRRAATGDGVGVLFVDLDHFKAVNDSLGHAAGDELLRVVAGRLRAAVRGTGTVARLSGDEFVVVDRLEGPEQAGALAQRLLEVLTVPVVIEGLEVVASCSVGAAVAEGPDDAPDALLRRADVAMYRAKGRGRGCWELHDATVADPAVDRLRLLGELRHGIERGELRLHYQPRMDLRTGRLHGVEALVRWQHPERGLLPPAAFIELAEDSGLVRPLGAWVLEEAVGQAVRWAAAQGPLEVAVNLSARQLSDPGLVDLVTGVLGRHPLDPALLTLEITETALMDDPEAALAALSALKDLGVLLAVDDFGTGYASLTYLQRFPIDELKIDRSFVTGLGTAAGDSAIVATCVQLARGIGIRAVAEGVEQQTQREALVALGCDLAQGYLWTPPLPPAEFAAWRQRQAVPVRPG